MPHSEHGAPLVKRQKLGIVDETRERVSEASVIFAPFRTVGLVSPTSVPFTSQPLGKTTFQITTSAGRCLQTYDLRRGLNLVFVTRPETPRLITATVAWNKMIFAAWGDGESESESDDDDDNDDDNDGNDNNNNNNKNRRQGLWVFHRGRKVNEIALPADLQEPLRQILVFGSWIVGLARTRIEVWKSANFEHYTTLMPAGGDELTGGMCTMPTFLNKIFVGRSNGWVEIWNVSSGRLIYTILPPSSRCGAVTCLEPSPALCLLAIAYGSGRLVVQDIVHDKALLSLDAGTAAATGDGVNDAPVSCISFRTDGRGAGPDGRQEGVMATASSAHGDVTFWDLNGGGRIMGVLRSAHNPPGSSSEGAAGREIRGGISKIEFLPGQPVMATSGLDNALKTWIFDETPFSPVPRTLHSRSGHAGPVSCLEFLPSDFDGADAGSKWLLSGGQDRSLWGWSLRRDGQSAELSQGKGRKEARKAGVLSAAMLRHGTTATMEDLKAPEITCIASSLNRDGGLGALPGQQKMWLRVHNKGIKGFDKSKTPNQSELASTTGWESVVTAHRNDAYARTWFWGRRRAGRWALSTGDEMAVSTVAVSPCGTFALVGSVGGAVDMYNLQSGLHRQRFPSRLTPAQARQIKVQQQLRQTDGVTQLQAAKLATGAVARFPAGTGRHTKAVTGIVVDSLVRSVVTCSLDGTIKFWDLLTGHLVDQLDWAPLGVAITACRYLATSELMAFACSDNAIRVVDLETKKTIREFWATEDKTRQQQQQEFKSQINDFCFSYDGRWIVAVTQDDARLRVWDLPTGHLIDSTVLARAGRCLSFSATGEFLAVAPDATLGVDIWTNKTLFRHVPTRPVLERPGQETAGRPRATKKRLEGPTASGEGGASMLAAAFGPDGNEVEAESKGGEAEDGTVDASDYTPPPPTVDQLSADMTTLSLVPKSRWQTLLHLDIIKQRNKPLQAPKAPEKAPFFLGAVASAAAEEAALALRAPISTEASASHGPTAEADSARSRILSLDHTRAQQAFSIQLHNGAATEDFSAFIDHLKNLPPAQADLELRSLAPEQGELALFVRALTARLRARRDYELVQAWMAVFLRLHGTAVAAVSSSFGEEGGDADLAAALAGWKAIQAEERARLDTLVGYCGGVVGFLRSPRS